MGRQKYRRMSRLQRAFYKIDRERILEEQGNKCYYCKKHLKRKDATMDHIIPLSQTKFHSSSNCVVACEACNKKKGVNKDFSHRDSLSEYEKIVHDMVGKWSSSLNERLTKLEYSWDSDRKGGFGKWRKYWQKRGRWD